jgi:inosose dehydratase
LDHMASTAADAGFSAIEPEVVMLGKYEDPSLTKAVLLTSGLRLAALAFAATWRDPKESQAEYRAASRAIELVAHFPGSKLVLVQLPGEDRSDLAMRQRNALSCMNTVGRRALDAGVSPTVHPNSPPGSIFRTASDYEVLLTGIDPEIGFTPDVGHIAAGGMDALGTIRQYRDRVDHVHFKDIDRAGVWAPTGGGVIDFPGIVAYLRDSGYRGWIVIEDESVSSEQDPDRAASLNGAYVRSVLAPVLAEKAASPEPTNDSPVIT